MGHRRILFLLLALGIVGVVLVVTAEDGPELLERVTTVDGVEVDVPIDWEPSEALPFEYRPPADANRPTDRWLVAWACAGECEPRSAAEWMSVGGELPTFVNAREAAGELLFDVTETVAEGSRVLRARTQTDETQVFVAVFFDGRERYIECGLSVFNDVDGLVEELVDACIDARPPS